MATTVTLHVFSGCPNPTWTLSPDEESQFEVKLRSSSRPCSSKPHGTMGGLGYRGFSITRSAEGAHGPLLVDDAHIEEWLLERAPAEVDAGLRQYIRETMRAASTKPSARPDAPNRAPAPRLAADAPDWDPVTWDLPDIMPYYNCYNYANNDRTHRAAYPGGGGGQPAQIMTCYAVMTAAMADGLVQVPNFAQPLVRGQGWYVALSTLTLNGRPRDHHWYRQDSNGLWSHKPGAQGSSNADYSNRYIHDPRNADLGGYQFCAYMIRPLNARIE